MEEETRTAALSFRIKPSLKSTIEQLAKRDRRTVASYVELVLEQHVAEKQQVPKKRRSG